MNQENLPRVLCVDDEPRIVDGLAVQLRKDFQVLTANGGQTALRMLKDGPAPAVIVSDMRMPGMDGATLLKHVKHLYPETTRILLTGEAGRDVAVAAVNEGQIFRFLTKPCSTDNLRAAIEAGVMQHRLLCAERVLLQETLIGCIEALVDILAITNPVAFGRATRLKRLSTELAQAIGIKGFWQLEAAAMLSQLGYISLPTEIVEKLYYGKRLTPEERAMADGAPQVTQKLLGRIPRLEPVLEMLDAVKKPGVMAEGALKQGTSILALLLEYDAHVVQGHPVEVVLQKLRAQKDRYDVTMINALESLVGSGIGSEDVDELAVDRLRPGMIFMDDLYNQIGTLLVPKGFEVTEAFLERVRNFGSGILHEKVRVMTGPKAAAKGPV
ncbi:MAG TPA: HD domain-containing phosphohydrolase [Steroidobacteraceae bacterium]|jgi:response regulator RpfG family c-di-GMP phosphodiesterase|nr:HD domain-containing phosphohydrolase [Steroidobacteraceae bacterium]